MRKTEMYLRVDRIDEEFPGGGRRGIDFKGAVLAFFEGFEAEGFELEVREDEGRIKLTKRV